MGTSGVGLSANVSCDLLCFLLKRTNCKKWWSIVDNSHNTAIQLGGNVDLTSEPCYT